jgi:hypothetical protein
MPCKACLVRGKTWNGGDPGCAFDGEFSDNWNCATLNAVRDICYEGQNPMPHGVDYQYCDDQKYATIKIDHIECDGERIGEALWVCWYKSRGRTDAVWVLDSYEAPRRPTEEELIVVSHAYKQSTPNSNTNP